MSTPRKCGAGPPLHTPEKIKPIASAAVSAVRELAASANQASAGDANAKVKLAASANSPPAASAETVTLAAVSAANPASSTELPSWFPEPPEPLLKRRKTSDVLCRPAASAGNFGPLFRWAARYPNANWLPEPTDLSSDNESEPPELADSDDATAFYLL